MPFSSSCSPKTSAKRAPARSAPFIAPLRLRSPYATSTRTPAARDRNRLTAARPLDTWQARLTEARAAVAADAMMSETIKTAVTAALRSILINTVGNFASRGRDQTHVTFDPKEIPADAADVNQRGKAFIWTEKARWNSQAERYYHPELAMQVWGRARARMLSGPMAGGQYGGALHVPPQTLLGVRGDAIYTTQIPQWSLPVERGGADDGHEHHAHQGGQRQGEQAGPRVELQDAATRGALEILPQGAAHDALDEHPGGVDVDLPEALCMDGVSQLPQPQAGGVHDLPDSAPSTPSRSVVDDAIQASSTPQIGGYRFVQATPRDVREPSTPTSRRWHDLSPAARTLLQRTSRGAGGLYRSAPSTPRWTPTPSPASRRH